MKSLSQLRMGRERKCAVIAFSISAFQLRHLVRKGIYEEPHQEVQDRV